jgi:hypothetical protein
MEENVKILSQAFLTVWIGYTPLHAFMAQTKEHNTFCNLILNKIIVLVLGVVLLLSVSSLSWLPCNSRCSESGWTGA